MRTNASHPEEPEAMTNPNILRLKAIIALTEAADSDDEDDARNAIQMIRQLLGGGLGNGSDKADGQPGK